MGIGCVLPKCFAMNVVMDCDYMLPIKFITSFGYPRSFIMARSLAWSMDPKVFLKSMYRIYISWFVNPASSNAAISTWSCRVVPLSALKPS